MRTINCNDADEFNKSAKESLVNALRLKLDRNGSCIMAIPGGRSVVGIFRLLKSDDLEWSRVKVFMIDERMVPVDDKESNYRQAKELFIDRLDLKNVYPFDITKGIEEYNRLLEDVREGKMSFDVVLLSSGEDGHIGGLYPNHHSIKFPDKRYFTMTDSPKPPPHRMSASRKMVEDSDSILLLFLGKGKKSAYENFMNESISHEQCPAKITKNVNELTVMTMF